MNILKIGLISTLILIMFMGNRSYTSSSTMSFRVEDFNTEENFHKEISLRPSTIGNGCDFWYAEIDSMNISDGEKQWLKWIVFCESTCNSKIENAYGFKGLVQFDNATWYENCNGNIWSGFDQLDCAIKLLRKGESKRWQCSAY